MRWLLERCKSGRFGSTQSTILALKVIMAYGETHARPRQTGRVILTMDGSVEQEIVFPAE